MSDFTVGQRVISAPGLHWLPQRVLGTVIDVNAAMVIVYLDHPNKRSGSRDKRRLAFTRKNILPLEG